MLEFVAAKCMIYVIYTRLIYQFIDNCCQILGGYFPRAIFPAARFSPSSTLFNPTFNNSMQDELGFLSVQKKLKLHIVGGHFSSKRNQANNITVIGIFTEINCYKNSIFAQPEWLIISALTRVRI
jgi:hypothetical protein